MARVKCKNKTLFRYFRKSRSKRSRKIKEFTFYRMLNQNENIAETNLKFAHAVYDALYTLGVRQLVLCPGSRNAPLLLAASVRNDFQKISVIDERSAAYFALGYSKSCNDSAAVITTSATAVTNLFPAVVEAYYTRNPFFLLTADRPRSLLNTGSNQTIDQHKIFGNYAQYYCIEKKSQIKKLLAKTQEIPIHINIPFAEPLYPETLTKHTRTSFSKKEKHVKTNISQLARKISNFLTNQSVIAIGELNWQQTNFWKQVSFPPSIPKYVSLLSNLRDHIPSDFQNEEHFLESLKQNPPDKILHIGGKFLHKNLQHYFGYIPTLQITTKPIPFHHPNKKSKQLLFYLPKYWQKKSNKTLSIFPNMPSNYTIIPYKKNVFEKEAVAVDHIVSCLQGFSIFLGNSLTVRMADFVCNQQSINQNFFMANRGASGIDGQLATALGMAFAKKEPSAILYGDVSSLHDLTSFDIFAKIKLNTPFYVFILNNGGGQIFRKFKVTQFQDAFTHYFLTKPAIHFPHLQELFSIPTYALTSDELQNKLKHIKDKKVIFIIQIDSQ
ncbi:MAG: 2-succinyl-5-enolpyruvyl-6-hydroxy-3-cyclohexene-1-carboxylic-acid synthase [Candidatus Hydrogenedentota bacterium]|nr:MAG: 2-succinyl-5-enolpyruvyl-6-hydroxy-3-cyclohexene-1-carboxylic-acid synthase [Candidatus Hydrogenedentota bacterium]